MKKLKKPKVARIKVRKGQRPARTAGKSSGVVPMGDRVLVKPLSAEEAGTMTSFGIIIPDTAKEKPEQGRVVAVGAGKKNDDGKFIPVSVKVGDRVMFSKYGFDEVKVSGIEYYLVSEANILAIIN